MRKISLIILAAIALTFASCRKTPDYVPYIGAPSKFAYSTYAEQFDILWNNINTGYVFWDVDETDWDEVYEEFMPKFEALDIRVQSVFCMISKHFTATPYIPPTASTL